MEFYVCLIKVRYADEDARRFVANNCTEITDDYHWKPQEEIQRFDWEAGDVVYVPPNTIHQHFNADPDRPARLISSINRIFKHSGLNDLEQIENAPEYEPGLRLTPEYVRALLRGAQP